MKPGDRRLIERLGDRMARIRALRPRMGRGRLLRFGGAVRPWTSDCLLNLNLNLSLRFPPEKTAEETNRDVQEIIFMTAMIRRYGFERLHRGMLLKELNREIRDEIRLLATLGVTS